MRVNIGFSNYSDDGLADEGDKIVLALTGNANFPNPAPTLSTINTNIGALRNAIALPAGPPRQTAIAAARKNLINNLQRLGQNLSAMQNVTPAMLATSGFKLPKTPVRSTQPPPAPDNVRLVAGTSSGEVQVRFGPSAGASSYESQWTYDAAAGPWNEGASATSTRGIKITGLTRAKDVWVRIRALGPAGYSAWSDPATILVG